VLVKSSMIPKVTHQIWFQGWNNLPEKYRKDTEKLSTLNPDWEHMKWDEEGLRSECAKFSPEAAAKFDGFKRMMSKIDFGRNVVLHNYGGVSVDCDAECLRPLEKIPGIKTESFIVTKWSHRSDFESWLCHRGLGENKVMLNCATILCEPGHPLMKQFIEFLIENEYSHTDDMNWDEEIQTGPTIFSVFFNHFLDDVFVLDPEIVEPWGRITKRTVLNHKYECSWMDPSLKFLVPYYSYIRNNFALFIIIVSIAIQLVLRLIVL